MNILPWGLTPGPFLRLMRDMGRGEPDAVSQLFYLLSTVGFPSPPERGAGG